MAEESRISCRVDGVETECVNGYTVPSMNYQAIELWDVNYFT